MRDSQTLLCITQLFMSVLRTSVKAASLEGGEPSLSGPRNDGCSMKTGYHKQRHNTIHHLPLQFFFNPETFIEGGELDNRPLVCFAHTIISVFHLNGTTLTVK
jgi:hypothetical protein